MELLTDDMDIRDTKLSIDLGGNGDYYLNLKETKKGTVIKLNTRIAMSGGNATTEVKLAIANLYRALNNVETSEQVDNEALLGKCQIITLTPLEIGMPVVYETGDFDGKRSDLVVVKTNRDDYSIARLYSGFLDGHSFADWYTHDDYEIQGAVIGWAKLPE